MDILSVFGIRGRSKEVHHLNDALRAVGLHPQLAPDSIKIATVKLLKEAEGGSMSDVPASCARAAPMLAYCMLGAEEFEAANGTASMEVVEGRLNHAIDQGESIDARLAMLTLLANVTHPAIIERYGLSLD